MSKRNLTNPHAAEPKPRKRKAATATEVAERATALGYESPNIPLASEAEPTVTLENLATQAAPINQTRSKQMDLNLTLSAAPRKSKRIVIYNIEGRTGSVQFLSTLFGGDQKNVGNPPATLTLSGEFAEAKAKVAKVAETKEERKARLAALPKPTLAEKIAKAEKRAEELRAKLAKQSAPAEGTTATA